ncbi:MAG: thrombospondin type 3 repeat-containing protein [Bacteroidota bacterium]|jgi:hypothetical protein
MKTKKIIFLNKIDCKNILMLMFCLLFANPSIIKAQHTFPVFPTALNDVTLRLPYSYSVTSVIDSVHKKCADSYIYAAKAFVPNDQQGSLISITTGTQNFNTENTPTSLLCKLLSAYKSGSINNILDLYRPQDRDSINKLIGPGGPFSDILSTFTNISKIYYHIGVLEGSYFKAIVDLDIQDSAIVYDGTITTTTVTPDTIIPSPLDNQKMSLNIPLVYEMQNLAGDWKLVYAEDSSTLVANLIQNIRRFNMKSFVTTGDIDSDGVPDGTDKCPCVSNASQTDTDGDGVGNACDNCPNLSNANQLDVDRDGVGNVCDNAPYISNASQRDADNDGIADTLDNCKNKSNASQLDADEDNVGDVCDNCAQLANNDQADTDGDGKGDVCDNCKTLTNIDQRDTDHDGIGDACDNDIDGDGIGNYYDKDMDGDNVLDIEDNCPTIPNPTQVDTDGDGYGDACKE